MMKNHISKSILRQIITNVIQDIIMMVMIENIIKIYFNTIKVLLDFTQFIDGLSKLFLPQVPNLILLSLTNLQLILSLILIKEFLDRTSSKIPTNSKVKWNCGIFLK